MTGSGVGKKHLNSGNLTLDSVTQWGYPPIIVQTCDFLQPGYSIPHASKLMHHRDSQNFRAKEVLVDLTEVKARKVSQRTVADKTLESSLPVLRSELSHYFILALLFGNRVKSD